MLSYVYIISCTILVFTWKLLKSVNNDKYQDAFQIVLTIFHIGHKINKYKEKIKINWHE